MQNSKHPNLEKPICQHTAEHRAISNTWYAYFEISKQRSYRRMRACGAEQIVGYHNW